MLAADFKPVGDLFRAEEENEALFRLEEAVHEIAHFVLCKGTAEGITADSMEIDKIVRAKYRSSYQQDLHELRTSLVTAWAIQLLIEDCPEDITDYCYESAEGNLLSFEYGTRCNAYDAYQAMQGHQINRRRAQVVAECARFLNAEQSK